MKDYNDALKYAFLLLKYRARSRQEIAGRLKIRKYPVLIVKKVLAYLEEHRFIDDKEFAGLFVSSCSNKGWGKRKISFALQKLGISKELSTEVLRNDTFYRSDLPMLIEKRIAKYKGKKNAHQKLLRYLLSRGFEYSEIMHALEDCKIDIHENS